MLKEIAEQPKAVADTLRGRIARDGSLQLDDMRIGESELREVSKIVVVACGTAYHAGMVAKYAIEHWTRIPVEVELASEFRYRDPIVDRQTLVIAISQSGETMDTLMALRYAREQGARVWPSATPSGRPSRARATPCCTPTPDRRSLGVDQGVPHPDRGGVSGGPVPGSGPGQQVRGRGAG